MRKYESLIIMNPELEKEKIKELSEKFQELIKKNSGEVENVDEWGKRKLAYPVENLTDGFYVLFNFKSEPHGIEELERVLKITDGILKYLILKEED